MKKLSLTKLIRLLKENNEEAFNEVYRRYHRLVYYIAFQLTKNNADAEEIVQETFVQVQRSVGDLKDPKQFKAWIGKIAHSKTITMLRSKKDQQMSDAQLELLSNQAELRMEYCPEYMNHHNTDMLVLDHCLAELKEPYREVLILYYFVQLNTNEIAEFLQCPLGTVKSRLLYGKKYLKEAVKRYEQENDIKLSFRAVSIEVLLLSAAYSLSPLSFGLYLSGWEGKFSHLIPYVKAFIIFLICAGTIFGGSRLYDYYTDTDRSDMSTLFSQLYYEDIQVTTPKTAYDVLLKNAHCEEEINQLNPQQLKQILAIYHALKQYGGSYYDLLYTYYWDKPFEELIAARDIKK